MSASRIKILAFQISYISDDAIKEFKKGFSCFHQNDMDHMDFHFKRGKEYLEKVHILQIEMYREGLSCLPYLINESHVMNNLSEALMMERCGQFVLEAVEAAKWA